MPPVRTLAALCLAAAAAASEPARRPNVLLIYLDDMGYGQPGCYGGTLAPTPAIDALAASGVRCTDGYVSAPLCSPSRVGLITGRYQARTGHEANPNRPGQELQLSETTIGQRFQAIGYATGLVGKWHLGDTGPEFLPASRGFDVSVGHVANLGKDPVEGFFRGLQTGVRIAGAPVTSPAWADESVRFIESHRDRPWLLYLALNAVHSPHVASPPWLDRFAGLPRAERDYAALVGEADEAVGRVLRRLHELGAERDTLVLLISDNGGGVRQADNGGLRGGKWTLWEGGIRVPWIASWPGRIPAGRTLAEPVIQLDALPTALAAAGVTADPAWRLDGVDLLPVLTGATPAPAQRDLYFRFGPQFAIRSGGWKLVKAGRGEPAMLVDLATDRAETTDRTADHPELAAALQARWQAWNAGMQPERWHDQRLDGDREAHPKRRRRPAEE